MASRISRTARSIRSRSTDSFNEPAASVRMTARALVARLNAERIGHRRDAARIPALAQVRILAVATERQLLAVARGGQRQLLRREHRRPVRRHPLAVTGVRAARWPLLHRREDLE